MKKIEKLLRISLNRFKSLSSKTIYLDNFVYFDKQLFIEVIKFKPEYKENEYKKWIIEISKYDIYKKSLILDKSYEFVTSPNFDYIDTSMISKYSAYEKRKLKKIFKLLNEIIYDKIEEEILKISKKNQNSIITLGLNLLKIKSNNLVEVANKSNFSLLLLDNLGYNKLGYNLFGTEMKVEKLSAPIKLNINKTINNPHTYLGYVRRENIEFKIKEVPKRTSRMEYKVVKFDSLVEKIKQNILLNNKILIYFPTVSLIEEFYDYLIGKNLTGRVVKYYGSLEKSDKDDSLEQFKVGNKKVMLATKAFGMGIDIEDISVISHFAPTGNLCDYLQEVGRAARDKNIKGQAIYDHMSNDFKYINRFHGLSTIKIYQLVEVIKKIYELHSYSWEKKETRKRNEMLIDTSTFSYIFDTNDFFDQDTILNKVKTALLLIQKDFENLKGWAPFTMRPMPLFAYGYFKIDQNNAKVLTKDYGNILENIKNDIYKVDLKRIWEKSFDKEMSFPKFKYFLYTQQESEIKKVALTSMTPYFKISLSKNQKSKFKVDQILEIIEKMLGPSILASKQLSRDELNSLFQSNFKVTSFKAKILTDIFLSTIDYYKEKVNNALNKKIYKNRLLVNGENKYEFLPGIESYYKWIKRKNEYMEDQIKEDSNLYIEIKESEEILSFLGFCEAFSILTFKSLGGEGGQLYIYVNERKSLSKIAKSPNLYKNKLLQNIDERHKINVDLLSHIYTSNFTSEEIWDIIENYFIGNEPENFRRKK